MQDEQKLEITQGGMPLSVPGIDLSSYALLIPISMLTGWPKPTRAFRGSFRGTPGRGHRHNKTRRQTAISQIVISGDPEQLQRIIDSAESRGLQVEF